ncbi:MAG: 5'-3' exonuclease H3TH domain-containing protein [Buchnera aphidicola (Nurudea yanoniella)]
MNFNQKNIDYLLIDGTSYIYRAYYSFPYFKNKKNVPSGAIYGVINMLKNLSFRYPYTQIIIIFDSSIPSFRNILFQDYKKNRPSMPQNIKIQIKPLYKIIQSIGFPIITIPSYEADDIIGTLSYEANSKNKFTLISTNDKDLAQLVNINTHILENISKKILGKQEIKQKYGVFPSLIPDLLGLMGDRSDNIPGVPKIGKKTALFLLEKFGSLNNVYKNFEKISQYSFRNSKMIIKQLIINKKLAFLSKNLATIKTNISINKSIDQFKMSPPSLPKLLYFFEYYEFYSWTKSLKEGKWLINIHNQKIK